MIESLKRSVLVPVADDLYLGNRLAAESRYHDRRFDHVLTVSHAKAPLTTVHRPLQDNERVDQGAFSEGVKTARTLFRSSGSLLIHCAAEISRSPTVVATTLTAERHVRSFELAIEMVSDSQPPVSPHPALLRCAEQYLNESIDRNAVEDTSLRVRAVRTEREIIDTLDENGVADGSLALGFAAMLALLYRDPAAGFEAATVDIVAVESFVILPVVRLLYGWYVAADGPYEMVLRLTFGTYLGIVAIGVMFGSLLSANPNFAFLLLGLAMLGLAVVALGTIALRLRSAFGLLESSVPPE